MTAIAELKASVIECIDRGSVSRTVIELLRAESGLFVPHETELWDYKATVGTTKLDQAELVRDILAFYNSFGGYLLIGVSDDYKVCGCAELSEQSIRQNVRNYGGIDVAVTLSMFQVDEGDVCVVHIPKRAVSDVPAAVSRIGPDVVGGKPIFKPGDVFFRSNDSSQLIRGSDDLRFLMGERSHPDGVRQVTRARLTPNNLPDRSVIFAKFFGRDEVKKALWVWLADPMSRYRVLAGPGGFGKTSAAYSFCEEVCAEAPLGLEQVVWLSAKKEQFNPSINKSGSLPYNRDARTSGESYTDYNTLLDAISYHFAVADDEWEGYDVGAKVRKLAEGMSLIPTLLVVDDLDSLTPDDQRMAVELAMSIGRTNSRFLFTTRKNYLAPLSSTTELKGLGGEDFVRYVDYLQESYGRQLKSAEVKALSAETEGSPLFTESIFRLLKVGARFSDALARWKNSDGEAVRAAAFRRELEQLSFSAKRALFAISLFESVSSAEIRQLSELEVPEVESAVHELDRLFLIQSRQIGDQARFGVSPNLRRLLQELKGELIPNHSDISRRAGGVRTDTRVGGLSRGRDKEVAHAIQQAMAQMAQRDFPGALGTVEAVLKTHGASADLQMVYARCLSEIEPLDVAKIRRAFQRSYDLGKREPQLFMRWIDFEIRYGNSNAAIDVAEKGAAIAGQGDWRWMEKRSAAHSKRGLEREARREYSDAMTDVRQAATWLAKAIRLAPAAARSSMASAGQRVHDAMWRIAEQPGRFSVSDRFDVAKLAVDAGDRREVCLLRMVEAIEQATNDPAFMARNIAQAEGWLADVDSAIKSRKYGADRAKIRADVVRSRLVRF